MLFTTLVLMKSALTGDRQAIMEIFHFWHEKGFLENIEMIQFFMGYIFHTHKINMVQLSKMLEESKIDGGEIMQTLAQQLKREGMKNKAKETAMRMLEDGLPIKMISKYTGLSEKQVKALMN